MGDQAVRRLTPAERGVWIDLIGLAAFGHPTGYVCDDKGRPLTLDEIARVTHAGSVDEVAKLIEGILDKGAASRDRTGRLFNRRMVRDTERRAKQASLKVKRAKAGHLGGVQTGIKYFGSRKFSDLPKHTSRQLPEHVPKHSLETSSKLNKKSSSESDAARASPVEARAEETSDTEQAASGLPWKKKSPAEMTRADFEAMHAHRSQCAKEVKS